MKRWLVRLVALSAVTAGGWFAVTWAQQHFGSQNPPPPDFSKPPVNAEAAAAFNNQTAQQNASPHIEGASTATGERASRRRPIRFKMSRSPEASKARRSSGWLGNATVRLNHGRWMPIRMPCRFRLNRSTEAVHGMKFRRRARPD